MTGGITELSTYGGVVTLDESDVPVIVELDADHVRLSASGKEIGKWPTTECHIAHVSDSIYAITAEDETLQFVPNQPSLFAAAVNDGTQHDTPVAKSLSEAGPEKTRPASSDREAPPPRPLTMGLFYALCVATAALAVWSLVSMIF
jgi:hypothetical protein